MSLSINIYVDDHRRRNNGMAPLTVSANLGLSIMYQLEATSVQIQQANRRELEPVPQRRDQFRSNCRVDFVDNISVNFDKDTRQCNFLSLFFIQVLNLDAFIKNTKFYSVFVCTSHCLLPRILLNYWLS